MQIKTKKEEVEGAAKGLKQCVTLPSMLKPPRHQERHGAGASLGHGGVNSSGPYVTAASPPSGACPHTATLQKVQPPYQLPRAGESKQDVPRQCRGADESSLA